MSQELQAGMRLVVASHNPGKVYEIKEMLAPYGLDAVSAGELDLPEPDETETTFAGNARLKATAAAIGSGLPALADDSGLEVDSLGGAPGIYSARWAGPSKDFAAAMKKVAGEVSARQGWAAPGPKANFICVLCLAWPDGRTEVFEGRIDGVLVWPPRGGNGFGYDPMFLPEGKTETFGEMAPAEKHAMSHRARAFARFEEQKLAHLPKSESGAAVAGPSSPAGGYPGLAAAAANLSTRDELAVFIANLRRDLEADPDAWQRTDLAAFLASVETFIEAAEETDAQPPWRLLARALLAGGRSR